MEKKFNTVAFAKLRAQRDAQIRAPCLLLLKGGAYPLGIPLLLLLSIQDSSNRMALSLLKPCISQEKVLSRAASNRSETNSGKGKGFVGEDMSSVLSDQKFTVAKVKSLPIPKDWQRLRRSPTKEVVDQLLVSIGQIYLNKLTLLFIKVV